MNKIEIKTTRLLIRELNLEDAKTMFKYRSDAETNKYQGWVAREPEEIENFIKKNQKVKFNIKDTWFQLAIVNLENNKLIGDIGLHFLDDYQVEIGCTLAKSEHQKGYATEALKSIIDFLFNKLNKHRVIGSVDPKNISSIKLLEKLNFRKEAHFKESLLINGVWVDDIIYAVLKSEWR